MWPTMYCLEIKKNKRAKETAQAVDFAILVGYVCKEVYVRYFYLSYASNMYRARLVIFLGYNASE